MEDERKATEAAKLHERTEEQARVREAARRDALAPQAIRQEHASAAQEAPDASRARYFELYDLAPVGYCTVSEHGLILEANLTAATFLGVARPDLVRRPCSEFILAEDQDLHDRHWKQLFETGQPQAFELRMLKQDGSEFWARLVATTGPSEDGERTGCVVMSDIDERRRAERMRIRSEAKFGAVFRATPDAYFLTSVPDGRIIEVNTAATRLAGFGAEEMLGRTTTELDLWADPAARDEYMARVRRDGAVRDFETQFRVRSGALIDGMISGEILQLDEGPCFLSVIRDVTESKRAERRLVASEGGLRSIIDNIQDAYFRADLSGRFTMVSPSAARMYGYGSVEEMIGLPAEALYGNRQERASIVDELRKAGCVDDHVGLGRRKDGTTFWVSMNAQFCRDASGNIIGTEGFIRDITERKRTEESLHESEARFRHMLQSVPNVAVQGYGPDGTTLYWNEASERLYGYTAQEAIGRNLVDLIIPPEMRAAVEQAIQRMAETGEQVPASEVSLMRKDGSRVSVFSSHATVQKPGQATELYCLDIDITERKRAEDALRDSEKDLRESQRIAHIGSWRLDVATDQVVWSEELYRMFGFDPSLPPPPYAEHGKLFTPESWESLSKALAATRETGIPYTLELKTVRKDGSHGWMWVRGEVTVDSTGKTIGLWGAAQDITERKQMENALAKKLDELERFNRSMVGRELRMVELKREINELLAAAGQPPKYRIHG
jgi:PAS domain S-box-containing protein